MQSRESRASLLAHDRGVQFRICEADTKLQSRESQEMPAFPMTEAHSLESAKQIQKSRHKSRD